MPARRDTQGELIDTGTDKRVDVTGQFKEFDDVGRSK